MRGSAHTLPTSRETGHTVQNRQTKVSSEHIIFTHAYMCHMTSEFSISPTLCTDVKCHYYFVCCRDDTYRRNEKPRITTKKRHHQKSSHKLNVTCLSSKLAIDVANKRVCTPTFKSLYGHSKVVCLPAFKSPFFPTWGTVSLEKQNKTVTTKTQDHSVKILYV